MVMRLATRKMMSARFKQDWRLLNVLDIDLWESTRRLKEFPKSPTTQVMEVIKPRRIHLKVSKYEIRNQLYKKLERMGKHF